MKKILVYEDDLIGHRLTYIKEFLTSFINNNYIVYCLAPENDELNSFINNYTNLFYYSIKRKASKIFPIRDNCIRNFFEKIKHNTFRYFNNDNRQIVRFNLLIFRKIIGLILIIHDFLYYRILKIHNLFGLFKKLVNFRFLYSLVRIKFNTDIDYIFIPNLVIFNFFVRKNIVRLLNDVLMPRPWGGLFIEAGISRTKFTVDFDFLKYSRKCKFVLILDDLIVNKFSRIICKKVIAIPDFIDSTSENEVESDLLMKIKKFSKERKICLVIGALSSRKNILILLKSLKQIDANVCVVAIGKIYEGAFIGDDYRKIKHLCNELAEDVLFLDCFIPNESIYNQIIKMSEIIHISYRNFPHSSNLLTKASFFKKPVIASNQYFLGDMTDQYKLGLLVDEDSVSDHVNALKNLANSHYYNEIVNNAKFDDFYRLNSKEKLAIVLKEVYEENYA